jgi:MFS family permease
VRLPPGLAPLRERNFALYWVGQATSQVGTWIEMTTTSWLLYQLTDSALLLGLGGIARGGPVLVLALVGGAIADRVPRRRLMLVTQSSQVATSLVLGVLVVTGTVQFWHIYVISFVNASIAAFDTPARQSLFPSLVPRGQLQSAVALNSVIFQLSRLIGPSIGGLLIAVYGLAVPYFVNATSYFAIIVALALMRIPPVVIRRRMSLRAGALGGVRYALRSQILPLILVTETCISLFGANQALYTIFARDVLNAGATGFGLLLSSVGAGALLGLVVLVAVGDFRRKGPFMLGAGFAYAGALLAFAWSRSLPLSMLILFVLGLADSMWGAMRNTIVQLVTRDAYRGRVMSMLVIVTRGVTQFSQLQTGATVSLFGPAAAATAGAGIVLAVVSTVAVRGRRLRGFESGPARHDIAEVAAAD